MRPTLTRRLEELEEAATVKPRIRFIIDEGQGAEAIEAEIAELKASGEIGADDVVYTYSWLDFRPRDPNWTPATTPANREMGYSGWGEK